MKLTIITINLNNCDGLRRTMDSVVSQTCQDFEYVVIDGGSTDGSREVIMEHQERLAYWCSEPDRGIYNAMNKGVAHATGDYCLFLNSGDYLYNKDVVKEVLPELDGKYDVIAGHIILEDSNGKFVSINKRIKPVDINFIQLINNALSHPACFIKKQCLQRVPYDEQYKIVSDKKFFIECYLNHNYSFCQINKIISVFITNGISTNNQQLLSKENDDMLYSLFPQRLVQEIKLLDPELLSLWSRIPDAIRFKKFLFRTNGILISLYQLFKR